MNFAVVPACGHSTRMGRPKLTLPLGQGTVIEHVVTALRTGGVETTLVVIGPHVPELSALAAKAGAQVLPLAAPTPDMRTTVEQGLQYLEAHFQPAPDVPWFLCPADRPAFAAETVRQLLAAAAGSPFIHVPVHEGRRGHPALFRWRHVDGLRSLPPAEGINRYLQIHVDEIREVPVVDPGIHVDLATPEDYARLCRSDIPV